MESTLKMKEPRNSVPSTCWRDVVEGPEGLRACQEYGEAVAKMLG